jgi:hypothetical protein
MSRTGEGRPYNTRLERVLKEIKTRLWSLKCTKQIQWRKQVKVA